MRMKLLLTILLSATFFGIQAHDPWLVRDLLGGFPLCEDNSGTPFQLSLWPVKLFSHRTVSGVNLSPGLISYQKKIYGISLNLGFAATLEFYGVQTGVFCIGLKHSYGLTLGGWNMIVENHGAMVGVVNYSRPIDSDDRLPYRNLVQVGVVNMAENGLQIGLLNYNPNAWIPWMILCNCSGVKEDKE